MQPGLFPSSAPRFQYRWYQEEAIQAAQEALGRVESTLVVLATGLGKTVVTMGLVERLDVSPVLFLAHRRELVLQAEAQFRRAFPRSYVGIEMADSRADQMDEYVCASVQTLAQPKRLERFDRDHFGLVVFDEFHHALAPSFRRTLEYFTAKKVGLTATPDRGDGKALGELVDEVCYVRDIVEGIDDGFLVPIDGRRVTLDGLDLDSVKKTAGDLQSGDLDEQMARFAEGIVQKTLELEPERHGILFAPGKRTAELCAERFRARGFDLAVCVTDSTPDSDRAEAIRRFKTGDAQFLCACLVPTEGFDAPICDLIIQARPTLSRSLYAQQVGRGTRVEAGLVDHLPGQDSSGERKALIAQSSKPNLMILDFVGNSRHELVTPIDILGGDATPAVIAEAKRLAKSKTSSNIRDLIAEAKERLAEAARRAAREKIRAVVEPFNPFKAFGMKDMRNQKLAYFDVPATDGQLALLEKRGMTSRDVSGLSKRQARRLIDKMIDRQRKGLATYKQLSLLKKYVPVDENVSFQAASDGITYIKAMGWSSHRVDSAKLREIVSPAR